MIGLDLDGTLLTDRKEFTDRSKRALRAAIDSRDRGADRHGPAADGDPGGDPQFPGNAVRAYLQRGEGEWTCGKTVLWMNICFRRNWRKKHWKSAESMIHYKRYIMTA